MVASPPRWRCRRAQGGMRVTRPAVAVATASSGLRQDSSPIPLNEPLSPPDARSLGEASCPLGCLGLVTQWLGAGVMEQRGIYAHTDEGTTPQGAGIGPLLVNIFLHYALDLWVRQCRRPATGRMWLVRHSDDFVLTFRSRGDAHRMQQALGTRFVVRARIARGQNAAHRVRMENSRARREYEGEKHRCLLGTCLTQFGEKS